MRILVTGGSGQLGTDVAQAAAAKGWQVWAPDHTELDITHPAQVESAIGDYRPDWVVHCAAYTAVDRAETEEKFVWLLMQQARRMWRTPARQQAAGCCIRLRIMCLTAAARRPIR